MAFKATLSVLFGCNFSQASRLLEAAEHGDDTVVRQVLGDKPQLAAFAGFHGTTSPLHRAAAAGHLEVCRSIIEPLKQRLRDAEAAAASSGKRSTSAASTAAKWQKLLSTVLNQRSHKSLTPLMLACEHGHAAVAAYLLREGADPLAFDFVHSRTCLHYAAVGGHADCLRLLCSESTVVAGPDGSRPLRDIIVNDVQVQSCRFIDQRAFGGLTALHFAVVTGNLEAVQALLRAGASIMVKSDGEAYIGEDFLVPGSTPLHVAVIISNISIVHAILQAHMEMMNILGTRLDERGRRPWEGTSRTDIRSVRNHFRKLPFHLARERQQPQLMGLVDPRIPIDVALDAARDTEHGIGPKRLSTICSLVLQRSLMQWLDQCQQELAREAAAQQQRQAADAGGEVAADQPQAQLQAQAQAQAQSPTRQQSAIQAALSAVTGRQKAKSKTKSKQTLGGSSPSSRTSPTLDSSSPPPTARGPAGPAVACSAAAAAAEAGEGAGSGSQTPPHSHSISLTPAAASAVSDSPFAALANLPSVSPPRAAAGSAAVSASAPVTPARPMGSLQANPQLGPASTGAVPGLGAAAEASGGAGASGEAGQSGHMQRMASLHAYVGMLSLKRHAGASRSMDLNSSQHPPGTAAAAAAAVTRSPSARQLLRTNSSSGVVQGAAQTARVRFLTDPTGSGGVNSGASTPIAGAISEDEAGIAAFGGTTRQQQQQQQQPADRTITVMPQHRRASSQGNARLGMMFGGMRERLRSGEMSPAADPIAAAAAAGGGVGEGIGAAGAGGMLALGMGEGDKLCSGEKELCLDSEGEGPSPSCVSDDDVEDEECGVCLDALVEVAFAACQHKLCLECARNLTRQDKKPPHCPFCRRMVVGFQRVSTTPSSRCTSPHYRLMRQSSAVPPLHLHAAAPPVVAL